jgi:hypothetical protein
VWISPIPVAFSAKRTRPIGKLIFPDPQILSFQNHSANQTLVRDFPLDAYFPYMGQEGLHPRYAKMTLELRPSSKPKT